MSSMLVAAMLASSGTWSNPTTAAASPSVAGRSTAGSLITQWAVPEPFMGPTKTYTPQRFFYKGPRQFRAYVGTTSYVQFVNLTWTRWGAKDVTARGTSRICDASGCLTPRRSTIVLTARRGTFCGDGNKPSELHYSAYVLRNVTSAKGPQRHPSPGFC